MFTWTLVILSVWMRVRKATYVYLDASHPECLDERHYEVPCNGAPHQSASENIDSVYSVPIVLSTAFQSFCLQRSKRFVYSVQLFSEVCIFSHPVLRTLVIVCNILIFLLNILTVFL